MSQAGSADAVVVAAGGSRRMGGQDKLEADLAGRPVLRWAVEAMAASPGISGTIVVVPEERVRAVRQLPWLEGLGARVVAGGARRQDSVAAGVRASRSPIVLVHDAARPLVSRELIARVIAAVESHGAAVPVLPVVDAIKHVADERVRGSVDRAGLFRAQTPQGARREVLLGAIDRHAGGPEAVADEVELLTRSGVDVVSVPGEVRNLKITLPEDLSLARLLVAAASTGRTAIGLDSHPFGPEDGLRLGGLTVEGAPRLHGHSDGDVVLHALCDGLLGAAGMGDLGRLFPSGEAGTRGIDSGELLAQVLERLSSTGLAPGSIDLTITGARPRLGGARLDAMVVSLSEATGLDPDRISIKAASGNLSGDEGAGRAISATCLVSLVVR